jgi:cell division septum initiation protein DivIVA
MENDKKPVIKILLDVNKTLKILLKEVNDLKKEINDIKEQLKDKDYQKVEEVEKKGWFY